MQQAENLSREPRAAVSAHILDFKPRDDRRPASLKIARAAEPVLPGPRAPRINGIVLGMILLPATMAIVELVRLLVTR